jgi:hypothetical protein
VTAAQVLLGESVPPPGKRVVIGGREYTEGTLEAGAARYAELLAEAQAYVETKAQIPHVEVRVRAVDACGRAGTEVEVHFVIQREHYPAIGANGHHQAWWRWRGEGPTWQEAIDGVLAEVAPYFAGEKPFPPIPDTPRPEFLSRRSSLNRYDEAVRALAMALRVLEQHDPTAIERIREEYPRVMGEALFRAAAQRDPGAA